MSRKTKKVVCSEAGLLSLLITVKYIAKRYIIVEWNADTTALVWGYSAGKAHLHIPWRMSTGQSYQHTTC
jgi:hypothetical protein